jgi:hypothetical protein
VLGRPKPQRWGFRCLTRLKLGCELKPNPAGIPQEAIELSRFLTEARGVWVEQGDGHRQKLPSSLIEEVQCLEHLYTSSRSDKGVERAFWNHPFKAQQIVCISLNVIAH